MVFISPILSAIFAAKKNETAVSTPATEKIIDSVVRSTPNFVKNQKATRLCITKPPANESNANNDDILRIICFDFGDRLDENVFGSSVFLTSISFEKKK